MGFYHVSFKSDNPNNKQGLTTKTSDDTLSCSPTTNNGGQQISNEGEDGRMEVEN